MHKTFEFLAGVFVALLVIAIYVTTILFIKDMDDDDKRK